jgi:hypothetical protein
MYFNGFVFCTKNKRYHRFGTISKLGVGKGSMLEQGNESKQHNVGKK